MAVKVTINNPSSTRVAINQQQRTVIRQVAIASTGTGGAAVLDDLNDVIISNPQQNQTLVYDSNIGKFTNNTIPVLDGGAF